MSEKKKESFVGYIEEIKLNEDLSSASFTLLVHPKYLKNEHIIERVRFTTNQQGVIDQLKLGKLFYIEGKFHEGSCVIEKIKELEDESEIPEKCGEDNEVCY